MSLTLPLSGRSSDSPVQTKTSHAFGNRLCTDPSRTHCIAASNRLTASVAGGEETTAMTTRKAVTLAGNWFVSMVGLHNGDVLRDINRR